MCKHAMNFRLSQQATNTLSLLENKLHTTKNNLLAYVGFLKEDEAKSLLKKIYTNRKNKPQMIAIPAQLLINNTKHFARIKKLKLENWA